MKQHRQKGEIVRRLRLAKKGTGRDGRMTQEELGRLSGVGSKETISKMERGVVRIRSDDLERIAWALGAPLSVFFDDAAAAAPSGLFEEAAPYQPPPHSFNAHIPLSDTQKWYTVIDSHLDQIGIMPGQEVIIDVGKQALHDIEIGDVLLVTQYGSNGSGERTMLRQWIPPHLLITNSLRNNELPLNTEVDSVAIIGVVVHPRVTIRRPAARR